MRHRTLHSTLILFARAPRWGTVKRRLAAEAGPLAALRFHRTQVSRLSRMLGRDCRWTTVLAVTPDDADGPWRGRLPIMGQGRGDLGRRMRRCLEAPAPGPVVLIGSDIPGVRPAHVARAFRLLGSHDAVFGPATDGGFWLVGLARRRPLPDPFAHVRWSTCHALADCLRNLRGYGVALADTMHDVDTADALRHAAGSAVRSGRLSPPSAP